MSNERRDLVKRYFSITLDALGIVLILGAASLDLIQNRTELYEIGTLQIAVIVMGVFLTLISSWLIPPGTVKQAMRSTKLFSFILLTISMILFAINLIGLALPLRNPAVYQGIEYAGKIRYLEYSAEEVFAQMNRIEEIDEQYPEYVKRLNQLIFDGTVHYWPEFEEDNAYNLRIPIHENYLIYFINLIQGENDNYEFCQAERAIQRSTCVCSQSSKILADILGRNRVRTHIVGLEGHVVARARVDRETDEWWILDADYGVVIEHDIDEIEANPELIREAYQAQGYGESTIKNLIDIYGPEGNETIDINHQCSKENHLYLLKWLIPALGVLPFASFVLINNLRQGFSPRGEKE